MIFFGSGGQEIMMSPSDNAKLISHILKTGAMINKNDLIFPVKCY